MRLTYSEIKYPDQWAVLTKQTARLPPAGLDLSDALPKANLQPELRLPFLQGGG